MRQKQAAGMGSTLSRLVRPTAGHQLPGGPPAASGLRIPLGLQAPPGAPEYQLPGGPPAPQGLQLPPGLPLPPGLRGSGESAPAPGLWQQGVGRFGAPLMWGGAGALGLGGLYALQQLLSRRNSREEDEAERLKFSWAKGAKITPDALINPEFDMLLRHEEQRERKRVRRARRQRSSRPVTAVKPVAVKQAAPNPKGYTVRQQGGKFVFSSRSVPARHGVRAVQAATPELPIK